ncbi:MAG: hypothetical protein Ct9H300mP28_31250 [Pseudomonadota bacterium]|nr:MAG: hypothetical protein Ct9H300mP28_31250 [Pseudomonadota bacterium]
MDDKEKTALYTKKQKNVIGKWMEQEMSEVAKLLRNEFMESGQVTDTPKTKVERNFGR